MKHKIIPGNVHINSFRHEIDRLDVQVFNFDCDKKYLTIEGYGGPDEFDGENHLLVYINHSGFLTDSDDSDTTICFMVLKDENWKCFVSGSKWNVRVCLYKENKNVITASE